MIQRIYEGIAGLINRRPALVALLILAIFAVGLYGMTQLRMDTGWKTYAFPTSPGGVAYSTYEKEFKSDSIVLLINTANPLDKGVLDYIERLEKDAGQQKYVASTLSIVDVLKEVNGGTVPESRAEIDGILNALPENVREKVAPSNVLTLVLIQLDRNLPTETETAVLNNVQSLVDNSNPPPGVEVKMTGWPAFDKQMRERLMQNMGILIGGAMLLMVLVTGILFAYVSHRLLPVLFVLIGLVTSLGLMGLAGIHLNMAVIGAFPVLIGLGIDYAIQFQARFDEEARKGPLSDAVFYTVTKTGPAVFYAMGATSMGFVAMYISTVPMIRSFGLVSIIGIFTSYWISVIGMPTAGLLLQYKPREQKTGACYAVGTGACDTALGPVNKGQGKGKKDFFTAYGTFLTNVSVKIARNPLPILLIGGLIALGGFSIDRSIPIESDTNTFVPHDMPAKTNLDTIKKIIGDSTTAVFLVQGRSVDDLESIKWLKEFQDFELANHPKLTGATSIVTYVLQYNRGVLPSTQTDLDAVLATIPQETRDQYLSGSLSGMVEFTTVKMEMDSRQTLKDEMIHDIAFLRPPVGMTVTPTGDFDLYTTLLASIAESKELMTFLGFILVFIFLALVYRHIHAVSPIIPIILIVGWNAVAMYLLGVAYNPITATLGSMTIGVAAEYTILVMERYSEEEEKLHDPVAAIRESVHRIGTSITVSGLATFFGFSALCLSTFPIISNFGVTTLIAVAFSLVGAIFIMPAVLSLMGRLTERLERRQGQSHSGHHPGGTTPNPSTESV